MIFKCNVSGCAVALSELCHKCVTPIHRSVILLSYASQGQFLFTSYKTYLVHSPFDLIYYKIRHNTYLNPFSDTLEMELVLTRQSLDFTNHSFKTNCTCGLVCWGRLLTSTPGVSITTTKDIHLVS